MTDADDTPPGSDEASTARDAPFARGESAESELAPQARRGQELPWDPADQIDPAEVELALLRSQRAPGAAAEGATPKSPGARAPDALRAEESAAPRASASGTLLSVGGVDPRAPTERDLQSPSLHWGVALPASAQFAPVTPPQIVLQPSLATPDVEINPGQPDAPPPEPPTTLDPVVASGANPTPAPVTRWPTTPDYASEPMYGMPADNRIHASLSAFRHAQDPDFSLRAASTRPEPWVARQRVAAARSDGADRAAAPTQRDLPRHRRESGAPTAPPASLALGDRGSDSPRPMTASIAVQDERLLSLTNLLAFAGALAFAVVLGLLLFRNQGESEAQRDGKPDSSAARVVPSVELAPSAPSALPTSEVPSEHHAESAAAPSSISAPPSASAAPALAPSRRAPQAPPRRQTIF